MAVAYDEKDAVGRRYRRQDALGTPFCITVDHQTLEDQTVTLRYRDSMAQERLSIADAKANSLGANFFHRKLSSFNFFITSE